MVWQQAIRSPLGRRRHGGGVRRRHGGGVRRHHGGGVRRRHGEGEGENFGVTNVTSQFRRRKKS